MEGDNFAESLVSGVDFRGEERHGFIEFRGEGGEFVVLKMILGEEFSGGRRGITKALEIREISTNPRGGGRGKGIVDDGFIKG